MPESEGDRTKKNQQIVESLREIFMPLAERLRPEIEPAVVYRPSPQEAEDEE